MTKQEKKSKVAICENCQSFVLACDAERLSKETEKEFPEQVEGEHFSKTVLVYDTDLEGFDLGFYDYDTQKWDVMGGFQMELICWSYIPTPHDLQVSDFQPYLTD